AYSVDVSALLLTDNALFIRFHALRTLLSSRRSRPKWRTGLVAHQQLRWYRTALLGRMPSWCPPVATVGPWRPVVFESGPVHIKDSNVRADLIENDGVVRVSLALSGVRATTVTGTLTVADSAAS